MSMIVYWRSVGYRWLCWHRWKTTRLNIRVDEQVCTKCGSSRLREDNNW